ncbi:MAG: rRNA methyltransferase [Methylocystaceae bacterium]|nr:rRNA methyltransferase [Methylocystaceae bacterium]NBT96487.1 rRNA methyltransferase [Methylocystaceae bacterium]
MTPGQPHMPAALLQALTKRLEGRSRQELRSRAQALSSGYRLHATTAATIRDESDALSYALTRMPATFAAVAHVLTRLAEIRPDFAPVSIGDVGCGLGAATYAAQAIWPSLDRALLLDRSAVFLKLAGELAQESGASLLGQAQFLNRDFVTSAPNIQAELVVVSYALTEAPESALIESAERLWASTGAEIFVIVEPGTSRDYARLMRVRAHLLLKGAQLLAPCPHEAACPLIGDWCHFTTRLSRSKDHQFLKEARTPFEDEKFSYLILGRQPAARTFSARLIGPPQIGKAGVYMRLCTTSGIEETFTARRDKALYKEMRRKEWGDPLVAQSKETE